MVGAVVPEEDAAQTGAGKTMANKFYVDEIYDATLVEPINKTSDALYHWLDRKWIDGLVNSVGKGLRVFSNLYARIQNGNIEYYLLYMVIGIILIVGFNLMK